MEVSPNKLRHRDRARRTLHHRILEDLQKGILSGIWAPGDRIPIEQELTQQYGCSRMTVNKAITELVRRGLIERRRKSGSYVKYPHVRSAVLEIRDIEFEVSELGFSYRYVSLSRIQRKADSSDRELLKLNSTQDILAIQLLHYAGDKPFCFEDRLISIDAVPEVAFEGFEKVPPGRWLIDHVPWSAAEHRIRAVGASPEVARHLDVMSGSPSLVIKRRTWNYERYITHVFLHYASDDYELVAVNTNSRGRIEVNN